MSTTHATAYTDPDRIEVVPNKDEGTVTFVADGDAIGSDPPTEWITIDAAATVAVTQ